jgi:benzoyl-CoA reductase subunit C
MTDSEPESLLELPLDADLAGILRYGRDVVEDPELPTVQRWRARGGKVLGHFQVYFPEELAHAAGFLPVKVRGAQVERHQADSHFGSYLCSILRTSLELALTERLKLDLFVNHPICDAARNLAGVWAETCRTPRKSSTCRRTPIPLSRCPTCAMSTRACCTSWKAYPA